MPRTMPRSVIVRTGISGSGTVSRTAMIAASSSVFSATDPMTGILHPFDCERDSLADADAHGGERELPSGPLKLLGRSERKARPRHAERMTQRDGAAVRVHSRIVVGDAELAKHGQTLSG